MRKFLIVVLAFILAGAAAFFFRSSLQPPTPGAELIALQGAGDPTGFKKSDTVREWSFPLDHGPHPDYQTEWWYYTGNLVAADGAAGQRFGYQLTFFRNAIAPTMPARSSDWATNQLFFAHFAITDVKQNYHVATERFSRGAAGLAGATGGPYHVWLENWDVTELSADATRVQLRARDGDDALDLTLNAIKPPVLQGDRGVLADAYYMSFTRNATQGTITTKGVTVPVRGESWMDHEFFTSALNAQYAGWDWFSLQLDDGREVMFYVLRPKDPQGVPRSSATLVQADGTTRTLPGAEVQLQVLDHWTSGWSRGTYPSRWHIAIPGANLDLTLTPQLADQENRLSIVYWEGAVGISGTSNGKAVSGSGYVELTGYAATRGDLGY